MSCLLTSCTSCTRHTVDVRDVMSARQPKWGRTSRPVGGYGGRRDVLSDPGFSQTTLSWRLNMPRRKQVEYVLGFQFLKPGDIPSELAARGWRYDGLGKAIRVGPDGKGNAEVSIGDRVQVTGTAGSPRGAGASVTRYARWSGGTALRVDAMFAVEAAEAVSRCLRHSQQDERQRMVAGRTVRKGRRWWRMTGGRRMMMYQLPDDVGASRVVPGLGGRCACQR